MPYVLDTRIESFQYLSAPTIMPGSSYNLTLPFTFKMSGPSINTATINTSNDGYINFGSEGIVSMVAKMGYLDVNTQHSYEVNGISPNRILKIEWKHQGLTGSAANNDSISYQMWLYETSNIIEWHFGPNAWYTGSFGSTNPLVMILYGSSYYDIMGSVNTPTLVNCGPSCHLNGLPANGKIYRLTPSSITSIPENEEIPFTIISDQQNGNIEINMKGIHTEGSLIIYDALGKEVFNSVIRNEAEKVQLVLKSGVYIATFEHNKGMYKKKFLAN